MDFIQMRLTDRVISSNDEWGSWWRRWYRIQTRTRNWLSIVEKVALVIRYWTDVL